VPVDKVRELIAANEGSCPVTKRLAETSMPRFTLGEADGELEREHRRHEEVRCAVALGEAFVEKHRSSSFAVSGCGWPPPCDELGGGDAVCAAERRSEGPRPPGRRRSVDDLRLVIVSLSEAARATAVHDLGAVPDQGVSVEPRVGDRCVDPRVDLTLVPEPGTLGVLSA
jgi:hypothetical protein